MKGTYLPTREFLRRNLGCPLAIISANTIPGECAYFSSKSLINRFTEFLHFEYQQDGVRTFAYHPGAVGTDLISVVPEPPRHSLTMNLRLQLDLLFGSPHKPRRPTS
ncbi:hypothetical protein M422DRAFT_49887 [Sphaerobolus stellatus SS14]|uniref:Unplaced genomic scaffold SPHSTscaffold_83, whole genome shotgun sequence n=1 Tax=Sphaerobolus stellatus (strain SS14) TaxID=990650 RepID=A0A0C9VLK0_SPHS4|nr:hypothetical protein M422DRAFT_49887 [Sphaerobolus stellatus SS14]